MSEHHTLNAILGKAEDLSIKRKHCFWHSPFACDKEKICERYQCYEYVEAASRYAYDYETAGDRQ